MKTVSFICQYCRTIRTVLVEDQVAVTPLCDQSQLSECIQASKALDSSKNKS